MTRRHKISSLFVLALFSLSIAAVWQTQSATAAPNAPSLELFKSIVGNPTTVDSGELFTYKLAYRCVSITENCTNAAITDVLPPEIAYISLTSNPTHIDSADYDDATHTVTFNMIDPLPAGSTGVVQIDVHFPPGTLPGITASNVATFDADNATSTTTTPVDIGTTGQFEMFANKSVLSTDIVVGFPIEFELELCSPDSIGGVGLLNPVFVDQLPPEAIFVSAEGTETVDWTYDSGAHTVTFNNLPEAQVGECLERTLTVVYNSLPAGIQTNTLTISGTPAACDGNITPLPDHCNGVVGPIALPPVDATYSPVPPFGSAGSNKTSFTDSTFAGQDGEITGSAQTEALPGETVTYTISAQNTGYLTLTNAILTDSIPTEITVTAFTLAPASDGDVSVFYETNDTGWHALAGNPFAATTSVDVATLGLGAGDFIKTIRWELGSMAPQGTGWNSTITGVIDPQLTDGDSFDNCSDFSAESTDGPEANTNCNTVRIIAPRTIPRVQKTNDAGPYLPGEVVTFTVNLRNDQAAHTDFIDPILVDFLPVPFDLITDSIRFLGTASGFVTPTQTIIPDYQSTGRTVVRWEWTGNLPAGEDLVMELHATVKPFTPPGRYYNQSMVFSNSPSNPNVYYCDGQPTEYVDTLDLDGDSNTTESVCQNSNSQGYADVSAFLALESEKLVKGARDTDFQKLGLTYPGGELEWKVVLTNTSNITASNIVIYDILSYIGDTGVIDTQSRLSQWRPNLQGPVVPPAGIPSTIYYSQEQNPCRPEVTSSADCEDDWSTVFPVNNPSSVQAIKLELCDAGVCHDLAIGESFEFSWPLVAPNDIPTDASCENPYTLANYQLYTLQYPACQIAWNSFGFTAGGGGLTLLPAEPNRVGIRASDPLANFALGNFVWLDIAGIELDHMQQSAEQNQWGVNGVRVELWNADTNAPFDNNSDGVGDFRYTGPDYNGRPGYYLFNDLPAGNYFVRFFPPAGFTLSAPNVGSDDALDSDGETTGTDGTHGDYIQTAVIVLAADTLDWDQGLSVAVDYGDLPHDGINYTYPVTATGAISPGLAARHIIDSALYLGNTVDAEIDGQPTTMADGDDTNGAPDDEDGIFFKTPLIPNEQACFNVTAVTIPTQEANLSAWFDLNGDGMLDDVSEQILADVQPNSGTDLGGGVYEHCFTVPATTGHGGTLYSRFRLSTAPNLMTTGTAINGEVEDYRLDLACVGNYIFDDNDLDSTQSAGDLGIEDVDVNLVWGGPDGVVGNSDDVTYSTTTDSDGYYHFCGLLPDPANDGADEFQVVVPTLPGIVVPADQGGDDALDSDGDANGSSPVFTITLPITTTDNAGNDNSYEGYPDNYDDLAFDFGFIIEYDRGDLPDDDTAATYSTNDTAVPSEVVGPIHQIMPDLYLGSCVDGEDNGQPSAVGSADADDTNSGLLLTGAGTCTGNDDEDGVSFATPLIPGHQACVHFTAQTAAAQGAYITAWSDFESNGDLSQSERFLHNLRPMSHMTDLGGGIYEHCFSVPANTTHDGTLYSRARLSTSTINYPFYPEPDGEVEDYALATNCVGNYIFDDNDGNNIQSAGDGSIANLTVNLLWGGADGLISTPGDNITYTTSTDSNGKYHFCGLILDGQDADTNADEYQVMVPTFPGDIVLANQGADDALDNDGDANGYGPIFDLASMNTDDAANDTSGSGSDNSGVPDAQDDLSFDFGFLIEFDWGDLPDNDTSGAGTDNYATNFTDGAGEGVGPSHQITGGYYLGSCVDGENDGQPSVIGSADNDDNTLGVTSALFGTCTGNNDEDGIVFVTPFVAGETACVNITASNVTANVFAFLDWNADGTLDTATERMIAGAVNSGTLVSGSTYQHCFTVPANAAIDDTLYSRFRYSTDANLDATGSATNGEVEDYATPLACVGNYIFMDDGGMPYRQDSADTGIGNVAVNLVWGGPDGIIGSGGDDVTYNTTTSSNAASLGEYHFCGLPSDANGDSTADQYQIQIPTPPASPILANQGSDAVDSDGTLSGGIVVAPVFTIADANAMLENERGTHSDLIPTGSDDNSSDLAFDFGFEQVLGAIGNYIWVDENSDGFQDAGEPGLPNVTVILRDAANTPIMTTTTDANGGYLFPELPAGTYSVDVIDSSIPSGMSQTTLSTNPGADFGNQDHSGNGYSVTIGNGQPLENLTADFGYNYNPTDDVNNPSGTPTAALGDRIWYDEDADGEQDPNEIGIYNVCVEIFNAGPDGLFNPGADNRYGTADDDSVSLGTQTTDYTGHYLFDNLAPGAYVVQICQSSLDPGGALNGLNQTGDPDHFGRTESGAAGEDDNMTTTPIILGPGDVFLNVDFGYDGGTVGSIGDTVFFDADADGNGPSMTAIDDSLAVTQGAGGSADSDDYGIPNLTVSLIRDLDGDGIHDAGEPIIATTLTDANGQYLFSGLPVDDNGGDNDADYIIWVNDTDNVLDGMEQTYDADGAAGTPNKSAVAISSGSPIARDQDFGYSDSIPQGSIGDQIWNDVDGSGTATPDAGEPGIAGVTINLFADANGDGIADDVNGDGVVDANDAIATTTTDENGQYLFVGLPLGGYLVEVVDETLPAGFSNTPTYDPDGTTPVNMGASVMLTEANPANRDQDFSYAYSDSNLSSIGDQIWGDLGNDGNNAPDAGDVPLAGVEVILTDSNGNTQTTTTDENGHYLFDGLSADTYTITVNTATLPTGYNTTPSYDPDTTMDSTATYVLGTNEHERTRDFSYPPTAPEGIIGDTVWFDIDSDGNGPDDEGTAGGDNNEPGIPDVCVHLYQDMGTIGTFEPGIDVLLNTTYTDANGHYLFTGLSLDDGGGDSDFDYVVMVDTNCLPSYVNPNATYDQDAPITDNLSFTSLSAGSISTGSHIDLDQDFGYAPDTALGTIGDSIWFDIDGNGSSTPEAGEPGLEGVVILLTDEYGNTWTTTTDENGNYQFGDLPLDTTYTVTIPASNFAVGGVLEGMTNTYDPDNNDDNAGVGVTLTGSAPVNLDQDFSYTGGVGQIGNLVWYDTNSDGDDDSGIAGSGEAPIANVTLDLYRDLNCDGFVSAGDPLFGSTTTVGAVDAGAHGINGVYDFDGLPVTAGGTCWAVDVTDTNNELLGLWKSSGTQGTDNHSQADPYVDNGSGALRLTTASASNLTADFGYYIDPAAVGNFVWFDINYNGVQDAGEFGINNVTVTLSIAYPDNTNTTVNMLTGDNPATAAVERGWYSFDNLLIDEDYATSTGTSTASATQPALMLSIDVPPRYLITKINDAAATNDLDDSDDTNGVAALATLGALDTTQNVTPTLETNPIASYDFGVVSVELGDLPDTYNTFISNNGAQHIIFPDDDNDNMPDMVGAIWAGVLVDIETEGLSGGDFGGSEGDDDDLIDDEDGLILPLQQDLVEGNVVSFVVTLRSRGAQRADYGLWIDWDGDGTFSGTNEFLSRNGIDIDSPQGSNLFDTTFTMTTTVPVGTVAYPSWIYVRGRVFEENTTVTRDVAVVSYHGLAGNGEVEDFAIRRLAPTAVGFSSAEIEQTVNHPILSSFLLLLSATLPFVLIVRRKTQAITTKI